MHEIDRVLKILAGRFPDVFLKLLFGNRKDVILLGLEDTQLNIPEYRSDKIFRLKQKGKETILNLEFMIQPRKGALKKFLIKTALLIANYSLPVVTIIVYLERGKYIAFPDEFEYRFLGFRNRFILDKILLWEYKEKIESGELLELAPLLPLFYQKSALKLLEKEYELISKVTNFQQRSDLIALAMMVAFRKYEIQFVQEFFKKEYQMLKESTFVKEWIKEGWEKGIKEGIKEGMEERIEYGKLALLLHLVKTKFKTISPKVESQLKKLKDKQIDELSSHLFSIQDIEELTDWLKKNRTNNLK